MGNLMRRLVILVIAVALVFGLGKGALAGKHVIKAVSAWPKTVYEVKNFIKFLEIVEKNVAGRAPAQLEVKYLGGPEVIPNRDQVEALRRGLVGMVFTTSGYYVSAVPVVDGLNLSELNPWEEREKGVNSFLNNIHNEKVKAEYLGRLGVGLPFMLFLNKPISKVSDLKGMKIRCSPTHTAFLKKIGAQPVVIPPPDVYTALERGVVDGFIWVAGLIRDWGWDKVVKYRVEPGFYAATNVVLINKKVWDDLPGNLKKILLDSEVEAEKAAAKRAEKHLAHENALMEKAGMKVIKLSPVEAKKLKKAAYDALWEVVIRKSGDNGRKLRKMISKELWN
ncbi:MAG: TRAP transporter substrate-binding protein DctP [Deltaproteobacteria bacterium]|nr:TRAP transporter substrate-binding protein DctP [Deltaproteobacteria bacterium]MBW2083165.1 TRAP transporter substrate-binding protein DctP [Deltaproteobacteria bacterium]